MIGFDMLIAEGKNFNKNYILFFATGVVSDLSHELNDKGDINVPPS